MPKTLPMAVEPGLYNLQYKLLILNTYLNSRTILFDFEIPAKTFNQLLIY